VKILHLLSQRPDSTGSGVYVQALLRQARVAGHENFLLAGIQAGRRPDLPGLGPDRCSFVEFGGADISFPIVGMSDVMPYDSRRFRDLSETELTEYEEAFAGKLRQAMTAFQPDLIHSHHLWLLSSLARRLFPDVPMIATSHGSDLRQFRNCAHLRDRVSSGCGILDGVLALSEAMKRDIQAEYGLGSDRIHVVGAGYDESLFQGEAKPNPDPVRLVYAGKLSRAKGVPWLLRALEAMEISGWELDLVGSGGGPEGRDCLRLAAELGDRVRVHGAVNQSELAGIMRRAHVFILPSFFEGLPLVVVEALACGCRVVVTDLPGVRELLGAEETAMMELVKMPRLRDADIPLAEDEPIFEQDLARAIAGQIGAVRLQPESEYPGLKRITSACTWRSVFSRIDEVYARIGAGNPGR
jgi:alpha-maltose-1-phosphate synthase